MREKESSEVTRKKKFTPSTVGKTIEALDNRGKRSLGNSSAGKSSQKPITKAFSMKEWLGPKVPQVRDRLGRRLAPTKRRLCLGGVVIRERA